MPCPAASRGGRPAIAIVWILAPCFPSASSNVSRRLIVARRSRRQGKVLSEGGRTEQGEVLSEGTMGLEPGGAGPGGKHREPRRGRGGKHREPRRGRGGKHREPRRGRGGKHREPRRARGGKLRGGRGGG